MIPIQIKLSKIFVNFICVGITLYSIVHGQLIFKNEFYDNLLLAISLCKYNVSCYGDIFNNLTISYIFSVLYNHSESVIQ